VRLVSNNLPEPLLKGGGILEANGGMLVPLCKRGLRGIPNNERINKKEI